MMNRAVLEQERTSRMNDSSATDAKPEAALRHKLEFLRELALALLEQIKSLEDPQQPNTLTSAIDFYEEVRRFETNLIRHALARTGGNQSRAARLLGIKLTTLNTKIKRHNIRPF